MNFLCTVIASLNNQSLKNYNEITRLPSHFKYTQWCLAVKILRKLFLIMPFAL